MNFLDFKGIIISVIVILAIGLGYFFINWLNNEPQINITEANIYEHNEFMFAGEADELGLTGGMGNYFKYNGNFRAEIEYLKLEDIVEYEISITLTNSKEDDTVVYFDTITNPSSLTITGTIPETDYFDEDFEEGILIITITYINRNDEEISFTVQENINVDEDFF